VSFHPRSVLIVGAGFSSSAGLPLASEFTTMLLNIRGLRLDSPSARLVSFIREFVDTTFGEGLTRKAEEWPELEDIFTLVDLAANSGHNLGPMYSAARLRLVRRAIIVRMIRMLDRAYGLGLRRADADWQALDILLRELDVTDASVLSMNWDTVVERGLMRVRSLTRFEYGCGARRAVFAGGDLIERASRARSVAHIIKPHGSVNWLYCDACREIFWVAPDEGSKVARTLFRRKDWDTVGDIPGVRPPSVLTPACPDCRADALGTRFATFSYRKALEFPMFAASWRRAEEQLKWARHWIFIGYSMPGADFEFKHLLKRIQLSEGIRPKITVITGGTAAGETIARYERFFGTVSGDRHYFRCGLDGAALDHLRSLGTMVPTGSGSRQPRI
jgi:hypothetical protein